MRDTFAPVQDLFSGRAIIRALSSMRATEAGVLTDAVANAGGRWSASVHDDYDGYLSVLIDPVGADQALRPSYYVSGTVGRVEIDQLRGDELSAAGTFDTMAAALASLDGLLRAQVPEERV